MSYRLQLLGRFGLWSPSGDRITISSKKNQALIAMLALAKGEPVLRSRLYGLLWADRGEEQARNSLRQAFSALRKAFSPHAVFPFVVSDEEAMLDAAQVRVDALQLIEAAANNTPDAGMGLYNGDFLEGLNLAGQDMESWLLLERQRFSALFCDLMAKQIAELEAAGDGASAASAARALLAVDPLDEHSHRVVMRAHIEGGDPARALKQFEVCKEALATELSLPPGPKTLQLAQEIRREADRVAGAAAGPAEPEAEEPAPLPASDTPTIAVLPFANLSGDPEQDYFADGITEDFVTELSRFSSLTVMARNTAFVVRDRAMSISETGKTLGARYLLEGSLRRSGNRIRLTVQLIDANAEKHVWADRYDRDLADIFDVQDELVHAIASTLAVKLTAADMVRSIRKPAQSLAAYDLYLQVLGLDRMYDLPSARKGRDLAERAVALDPGFARAHAVLAAQIFTLAWFESTPAEIYTAEALDAAAKAVELDPDDSLCTACLGTVHLQRREYEEAGRHFGMALNSNPHDSFIWGDYAWYLVCTGKPDRALRRLDAKEVFEPHPPSWHWEVRAKALYMLERYEDAKLVLERMATRPFWINGYFAACCGQLGEVEAARTYWRLAREAPKGMGITFGGQIAMFESEEHQRHWAEGLQKANLLG